MQEKQEGRIIQFDQTAREVFQRLATSRGEVDSFQMSIQSVRSENQVLRKMIATIKEELSSTDDSKEKVAMVAEMLCEER